MLQGISRIEEGLRRNQRQVARAVLAALIGLLAVSIALPAGGRFGAIAQEASPSPTGPAGPQIRWVNPEEGTSTILSTKEDVDQLYHFVAAVSEVPTDPSVRFEMDEGDIQIATATRVGDSDTWEHFWDLAGHEDGTYELTAILFSGGTEVDRHDMEVEINNADDLLPPDDQAETAEIVYPENAGGLGYHTNAAGETRFVVDGVVSEGATSVSLLYTTSPPGSDEPEWTDCASDTPEEEPPPGMDPASSEDAQYVRIVCEVGEEDDPAAITAVALVPDGTPMGLPDPTGSFVGAADGHRVAPYLQVPTAVSVSPATQAIPNPGAEEEFGCSENITATVLDAQGRFITGVKVDVHAAGPNDNLRFATDTGDGRSASQPPGDHATQSGWHCGNGETSGSQGAHARQPDPDIKHIQTVPEGTDRNGNFVFALRSNATGPTQFTAWADIDNDNRFCAEEPSADGSIGWGETAPAPVGLEPEVAGPCPGPSPTPTGTPGPIVESGPCAGEPEGSERDREGGGKVIVGTQGDDILEGTDEGDLICGLGGHDDIRGRGWHDDLHGGRGGDTIRGGAGQDLIIGGGGHDTLIGNKGHDVIRGNRGQDVIRGGRHNDLLVGGKAHDTLRGGRGHDDLRGNRGNDGLFGGRGNDTLNGGPGHDVCRGGRGADTRRRCED